MRADLFCDQKRSESRMSQKARRAETALKAFVSFVSLVLSGPKIAGTPRAAAGKMVVPLTN